MKCQECQKQLLSFLDGEVSHADRMEIQTHLLTCTRCKEVMALLQEETETLSRVLNAPALPDHFADELIQQLLPYQPATQNEAPPIPGFHKERRVAKRRPRVRVFALSLVLGLFFSMVAGMYLSPTFAAYVSSFISRIGGEEGLKKAAIEGYSTPVNKSVTDKGVTLRIKDVVADKNRVVVSYVLEDEKGKVLPDLFIPYYGENEISIKDKQGNVIDAGKQFSRGDDYADFMFSLQNPPDDVIIHFDIHNYGSKQPIPVKWQLDIPINLTKALEASKTVPIKATYEAPEGIQFSMEKVTYSPSATRFDLVATRSEQANENIRQAAVQITGEEDPDVMGDLKEIGLTFHIVDQNGQVVADSHDSPLEENRLIYFTQMSSPREGAGTWIGAYVPGPESESLTFVLDSLKVREKADFSMEFSQEELKKGPITKEYAELGRSYTIKRMEKGTDPESGEPAWEIELEGIFPENDEDFPQRWSLVDAKGTHYEVTTDYTRSKLSGGINEKVNHLEQILIIKGLAQPDAPLKLSLQTYWKEYKNLDWKVPIPQAK